MASLGSFLLLATFVVAAYALAASVAGARRRHTRLIESGIGAFYTVAALMTVATGVIVYAFVAGDYSIRYVQRYSDSVQPLFYKITSYWGGLDGSVMFWVFLLSLFGSVAVKVNRDRHRELIPYVVAVISAVEMFFLFLMIIHNNPFDTYLTQAPTDGRGLNPLLQNFYMAIHPPTMYLGFVGLTIPFAFGMAALFTGHLDDSWLRAVRRWTMFSWFFLSLGLTLGMIWAYEELGWGGFWGWDPVENAGPAAVVHGHRVPALGDGAGAARHAPRVERHARHHHVPAHHLRHVHDPVGRGAVGARLRRRPGARAPVPVVHGRRPGVQLRLGHLPAAAAAGAPRARFVGVARGGVPGQQLDPAVLRVLRPVRHDVPDHHRGDQRRAPHGGPAVLQPLDDAHRPRRCCSSRASGRCWRGASRRSTNLRDQFLFPVAMGLVVGGGAGGHGRPCLELGHLLRAVRRSSSGPSRRSSTAAPPCGAA